MLTVIKTALVTITISFISGVLLDAYKNYAPRILCSMGKGVPIRLNNKRIKAYTLMIKNISNKTLHNLTLCIQEKQSWNNLKIDEARITGGLKFDISNEEEDYNVSIPFLSRNDQFTVKLFVENHHGYDSRPIITLRSPENFKRVDRGEKNGLSGLFSTMHNSIGNSFECKNNQREKGYDLENRFLKKKALIATGVIIFTLCIGVFGFEYYYKINNQPQNSNEKSDVNEKNTYKTSSTSNMSGDNSSTQSSSSTNKSKSSSVEESTDKYESKSDTKDSLQVSGYDTKTSDNKNTDSQKTNQDNEKSDSSESSKKEEDKTGAGNISKSNVKNENSDKDSTSSTSDKKTNQESKSDTKPPSQQNTGTDEEKKSAHDSEKISGSNSKVQNSNSPESASDNGKK
ncbi:MAG: hypothetical protein ACI398_04890 [Clostridium sp.]